MNIKKISIVALVLILTLAIYFLSMSDSDVKGNILNQFSKLATVNLIDYSGREVKLSEYNGKPLVINSWAVWCPFCRAELEDFSKLQKEFDEFVIVIAINRQEPIEKAKGYTDDLGITQTMTFLLDEKDAFYKQLGGFSMPETIFVNKEGEIVVHKRGPMDLSEMREHTNKIVN